MLLRRACAVREHERRRAACRGLRGIQQSSRVLTCRDVHDDLSRRRTHRIHLRVASNRYGAQAHCTRALIAPIAPTHSSHHTPIAPIAPDLSAAIAAREAVEKIYDRRKSFRLEKYEAAQLGNSGFLCLGEDAACDDQHGNVAELRNLTKIGQYVESRASTRQAHIEH